MGEGLAVHPAHTGASRGIGKAIALRAAAAGANIAIANIAIAAKR